MTAGSLSETFSNDIRYFGLTPVRFPVVRRLRLVAQEDTYETPTFLTILFWSLYSRNLGFRRMSIIHWEQMFSKVVFLILQLVFTLFWEHTLPPTARTSPPASHFCFFVHSFFLVIRTFLYYELFSGDLFNVLVISLYCFLELVAYHCNPCGTHFCSLSSLLFQFFFHIV